MASRRTLRKTPTTSKRRGKTYYKRSRDATKARKKSKGFFFGGMGRDLQANPDGSY